MFKYFRFKLNLQWNITTHLLGDSTKHGIFGERTTVKQEWEVVMRVKNTSLRYYQYIIKHAHYLSVLSHFHILIKK